MKKREEVKESLKWDLTRLFKDESEYQETLKEVKEGVARIVENYQGELDNPETILKCLKDYEEMMIKGHHLYTYAYLATSVDEANSENQERLMKIRMNFSNLMSQTSFIESEIKELDDEILDKVISKSENYQVYLGDLKRSKEYKLDSAVEKSLSALSPVLDAPQNIYNQAKLADLDFDKFEINGEEYPLSFVLFENEYQQEADTEVRRKAFEQFSKNLEDYKNTMASTYSTQIQKEKIMADMRGYDDIFEYLLFDQKVDRELYDRQIDLIMEKLAPHMRKYATHLKELYNLDKMTYADLKIPLDPDFEPEVTVEESKKYVEGALSALGEEYKDLVMKSYDERWVDFAQNKGKSTGGFCSTPYGVNSYILLSWTGLMSQVYTLVHELGHAGHFILSQQNNRLFEDRPSTYFVEAPSTINELLLTNYLIEQKDEPRFQRWALATMIGNTYYHNFVTHLLEAAYQREVYKLIDDDESIHAEKLNKLKKEVLEEFWGDAVEITDGAELTWMRQPHYYMGLYSYTYSAGLTVATAANQRIKEEGQQAVNDWINVLKAGGTKTPVELAKMAGVDITTAKPLNDTIDFIGESIDKIIELSGKIEK
ncbi:oligoendopeptidase F [Halanaerobiaceae bacterium Z-7014]|uniref:Oligopeptidase F n=1 Tax=Halonatronomonas betaini TaxID=2778430 RepID=A0A931F7X1_9FIRM|nr:oligoendopeptidase F [Halonatronomonas betaini]